VVALAAAAMLVAVPSLQAAGLVVTTPTEALAAVSGELQGVARGAADLQAQASTTVAGTSRGYAPALTASEATAIAKANPTLKAWLAGHPVHRDAAEFQQKDHRWKISFVSGPKTKEVVEAEVYVDDETGDIHEVRVGPQVAWMMARGYEGAFGRGVNHLRVWVPLSLVFLLVLLPITRPRRMVSWRTLDLLVLLSFSISWWYFNRGEIFTSVPWQYPPLIYLLARMVWITTRRARAARGRGAGAEPADPFRARTPRTPGLPGWLPTWALVTVLVVLMAFRWGLNAFDSNVIDVGYAGVIGADLIQHGTSPYGHMPKDCGQCDTYGPLNYIAYVPFEAASPYTGRWDDLPAAHGAATLFDALAVLGLLVAGWRLAGRRLGLTLAIGWAAFPFTAFTLSSNSNDALVAAAVAWGLVFAAKPLGRGLMLGLGIAAKIVPVVLVPLWARHPFPKANARAGRRRLLRYLLGLAIAAVLTGWVLLLDGLDGISTFWSRTIEYQAGRDSPFSIWGQHPDLSWVHMGLIIAVAVGALAVLRWPRRIDLVQWAAVGAAVLIGFELTLSHWFYLYIPWFLPLVLFVVVPEWPRRERDPHEMVTA
jgi:hypothetical protein